MDKGQLEAVLSESESTTLDFKRDQYRFDGGTDEEKAELLKDILAFANAWRRAAAFIVIGVDEQDGNCTGVVGVAWHLEDAKLQQFVNAKTQRPLQFSYTAVQYEGVQLGVLRVPIQERPFFLKKPFGKLAANTVYIRRGSSTDIAKPDEVARMGSPDSKPVITPRLVLSLAEYTSHALLGTRISGESMVLDKLSVETLKGQDRAWKNMSFTIAAITNLNYENELIDYVWWRHIFKALSLAISNESTLSADDVVVEVRFPKDGKACVLEASEQPEPPTRSNIASIRGHIPAADSDVTIRSLPDSWKLRACFPRIRPGSTEFTGDPIYFGALEPTVLTAKAVVYGHNIAPSKVPLEIHFNVTTRPMTPEDVEPFMEA